MYTSHTKPWALRAKKCAAVAIVLCVGITSLGVGILPHKAKAAVSDWQKAVSIAPRWSDDFTSDSFKQSVRNAQSMGAKSISLVIPWYQSSNESSDIRAGSNAPSDTTLGQAIDFIHGLGMKVILKPHLETASGAWRGNIDAIDRNAWYQNYSSMLDHLGDLAATHNVEMIVTGTELVGMASWYMDPNNTTHWRTMIQDLRTHYHGALTYSANWGVGNGWTNEFEHIGFWSDLDYIGISAYFGLGTSSKHGTDDFVASWQTIDKNQIQPLHTKYNKPILFTEVGYKSVSGTNVTPWDHDLSGAYDPQLQSDLYQALFQFWNTKDYMAGAILWDWNSNPSYGGTNNTDYTPNNKPAETTIQNWWKPAGGSSGDSNPPATGTTTPPQGNTPAPTGDFGSTSDAPDPIKSNNETAIPVTITTTGNADNIISDVEIYDSSNSKIFQKFFENQNLSSTAPGQYTIAWTPSSPGTYRLKTGVFKSDWSVDYYWNDAVQDLSVTADGTTPPKSVVTDVWWPVDGAVVGGNQPFKVMLEDKDVSEYTTTWRLEGNGEVSMGDSSQDWPHKESIVDVSGWQRWKDDGPYKITFTSKDLSGNVISEKSVNIYVK